MLQDSDAAARHPCAGLTRKQREAFERIAIGDDRFIHPATGRALMKRGLIERHEEHSVVGGVPFMVWRYSVPLPVHIAWCLWCGENISDADVEAAAST